MAEGNGLDSQSYKTLFKRLETIDERTKRADERFESMKNELTSISRNTGVVADYFSTVGQDNRELSRLAAGKHQVPLYLFVLVITFVAVYILADKVSNSQLEIRIPYIMEITRGQK